MPVSTVRNSIGRAFLVLNKKDKKRLALNSIAQVLLSFIDLAGVIFIGVLGALAIKGVSSQSLGNQILYLLKFLKIENFSLQSQVAIIGIIAAGLLVSRTLLSVLLTKRNIYYLSQKSSTISQLLLKSILEKPLEKVRQSTTQETIFGITTGVNAVTLGIIANSVSLIADSAILLVLLLGLLFVDPTIALTTAIALFIVVRFTYKKLNVRAKRLGASDAALNVSSNQLITEAIETFREVTVRNRQNYYVQKFGTLRDDLAYTTSELTFLPNITKYVIEITIVIGALVIGGFQFLLKDASHAVATISIFFAATARIAPSVMRVQQSLIQIQSSSGLANNTLNLLLEVNDGSAGAPIVEESRFNYEGFVPQIEMKEVSFKYENADSFALRDVKLSIKPGSSVAIVGPSGSGKTTLVDLILGILSPVSGNVSISDLSPRDAISRFPGAISYVPQDIVIINGSIEDNVCLGYSKSIQDPERIQASLNIAQLSRRISELELGVLTPLGEKGAVLSGGERQRLGVARALFSNPSLLVLDEASSALDGETEAELTDAIGSLKGKVTVLMIAHRLSTVKHADSVIYLEEGTIRATGTFEEVRAIVPNFDKQAKLMGL